MRRLVPAILTACVVIGAPITVSARAQQTVGCAARFPGAVFDSAAPAGPVTVRGSGINIALTERIAADLRGTAEAVGSEIGGLDGVEVCVFADRLPLDGAELGWPEGQSLRAAAFGDEGLVVLSSWLVGTVPDAAIVGVVHLAEWRTSGGTYPEPFGSEVMGYYAGLANDTLEQVHNAYVRANTGQREPWPAIPWTAGRMVDPLLWNPELGHGGAGDFGSYAHRIDGPQIFANPDPIRLAELDEGWRNALFDESGSIRGGSKGWIGGLIALIVVLAAGVTLAYLNRLSKRRAEEALREAALTARRAELEAAAEAGPVTTSVVSSVGRRDPRVRSGSAGAVARDRDEREGSPARGPRRARAQDVTPASQADDDIFRHPSLREQD
jgi:hypothetical protein